MTDDFEKYCLEDEYPDFFRLLREDKINIAYSPIFREFSIPLKHGSSAHQQMQFCPWSGKKFPPSLRDQFICVLEREFGFKEPTMDDIWEKRVPKEMQSEEWWIKRGL